TRFSRDWSSDVCSSDLSLIKIFVLLFGAGKRVKVFHQEFPSAHNAGLGAKLISEFSLELVNTDGEVAIGRNLLGNYFSQRLFVSCGKAKFAAVFQNSFEPNIHNFIIPPACLLPCLRLLQSSQRNFLAA